MKRLVSIFIILLIGFSAEAQRLIPFLPEPGQATGAAVVVCPGGSYLWLGRKVEGTEVAEKLRENGIAAFVLYYRHAGTRYFLLGPLAFPQTHYPKALQDVQNAVISIRSKAGEYGIDTSKIGVMGFSAGGHLALNSAEEHISSGGISSRPSFVAAIYPVVTMSDEAIIHERSRKALLGSRRNDPDLRRKLSMELDIPASMPPAFVVSCMDDPTVDYHNSVALDSALTAAGIPHEYHQFKKGGHGFGSASKDADWLPLFLAWVNNLCIN